MTKTVRPKETGEGGICFMGSVSKKHSFYFDHLDRSPIWVDNEDYEALFKKFLIDKTDPPVLLLSGLIFDDGEVELKRMYMMKEGIIDEDIIPGDYSIQILDNKEKILVNIPFSAFFEKYIDPETNIEKGVSGFTFVIPYPETASKLRIQHSGEVLIEINPNTK